jgi:cbb3-type cytochrome oxidase subunit 3
VAVPASVLGLAYFARLVMRDPSPDNIVLTAFVWVGMPLAVAFAVWNQIGTWRPDAQTTRAYAELSYKRALSELRGLRFAFYVLYAEACFLACVTWIFRVKWVLRASPADRFAHLVVMPVFLLGMWIFIIWRRRSRNKQLAEAKSFLEQLDL